MLTNKVRPSISEEGIMTIPNNQRVEKMAQSLYKDFKEAGVPDNILKTENDIKVFHHKIAEINNDNIARQFDTLMSESTLFNPKKSADVFDLKGNKIKNPKNILGGEELIDPNSEIAKSIRLENESKKLANSMSDAEIKLRGSRPYDTDEQILQRLNKRNKEGIESMKSKLDDAEDLSEGTYSFGFKKGKEFQLNANSMGKGTLKEIIDSGELLGDDLQAAINALKNRKADGGRIGEELATGGIAGLRQGYDAGSKVIKYGKDIFNLLKNKKKLQKAFDNIFTTDDYKMDMEMVAESLVELNPKVFKNKLYDDLPDELRSEIYGAAMNVVNKDRALKLQLRKGAVDAKLVDEVVPEINRESMKLVDGKFETTKAPRKFKLNVDTFVRDFPVDKKEAERIATLSSDEQKKIIDKYLTNDTKQRIELMNFEPPKDREPNFKGGRIGFAGGSSLKLFLKNFFKTKPKKLETVNDFVDKRQFLKDLVGNTEKNKKARELKMLKEAMEEARENPGFKFKDIDVDKEIKPIFDQSKDRTLNAGGGIITKLIKKLNPISPGSTKRGKLSKPMSKRAKDKKELREAVENFSKRNRGR